MRLKTEIRRRRQARIEQIRQMHTHGRESSKDRSSHGGEVHNRSSTEPQASTLRRNTSEQTRPPKDPEEAWKRRVASWSGQPYQSDDAIHQPTRRKRNPQLPAWGGFSFTSLFISASLFILVWGVFQIQEPWAWRVQSVISNELDEPFQAEQVATWYESIFGGAPSWIPAIRTDDESDPTPVYPVHSELQADLVAPSTGQIVTPFAANGQGILMRMNFDTQIKAAAEGRVVFNGETSSGQTIVIQHPDQVRTVYGWLEDTVVMENDWVEQGDIIARGVQERNTPGIGVLYFSVRAGDQYVDPVDVIEFD